MQVRGQNAGLACRNENNRPCAVAEQHACAAVVPIKNPRIDLCPDDERVARHAARDHAIGKRERINESRAYRLYIERRAAMCAKLFLEDARGRWKDEVGCGRRHDDQIKIRRRDAGLL